MVSWTVTVEGTDLDAVSDVEPVSGDAGRLGTAKVVAGNTAANRAVSSGDDAQVKRNGTVEFDGKVTKAPGGGKYQEQLEFTIADNRVVLRYIEVHRPFYEMDTGDIIKAAVTEEASVRSPTFIHRGDDLTGWSSDTPEFELLDSDEKRVHEYGSNVLFAGWPGGSSGDYSITFTNVPSSAIPGDGQIIRLTTRMLVNNRGDQIECEVDLRDNAGNNYIWTPERLDTNFREYTFAAEDAVSEADIGSALGTNGALEYRFRLKGNLPEPRAVGIDMAQTLPFVTGARTTDITVNNVQTTGRTITRRFDENVMQMLQTLGDEDGFDSWVDSSDDLHYEPGGTRSANFSITDNTPVTDYNFDRDYDRIVNKVTVQGANDIQVTAVDSASIDFYGISEREEQIVDREIQTEAEADRRAREYLEDNAWHDTAIMFEVADVDYAGVSIGEAMRVQWSPEGVDTIYNVSKKTVSDAGYVTLHFSGYTGGAN
ncbi:hypothetical protein M197_gp51 [Haloarcula hispanica tailed virus 2]|uniref:Uncharacterized protein n=1 Tax=Haloarcula hispanica tailed virus 2 TaxID=1273751 RepID=R4TG61_9CAUD|nr:hypothetical protein M197_gp51 [Haloarcula hispanica tailed virus 2]AGM11216.1 hypothetical protein HHTV2_51 [Haloarcula hispanica tailed virus 2]